MASRKTSKQLAELGRLAYERELSRRIDELHRQMNEWRNGKLSVWDIEQSIHEFHNKTARELYRSYAQTDAIFAVAIGIAQGVIHIDDVPEEARDQIQQIVGGINRGA